MCGSSKVSLLLGRPAEPSAANIHGSGMRAGVPICGTVQMEDDGLLVNFGVRRKKAVGPRGAANEQKPTRKYEPRNTAASNQRGGAEPNLASDTPTTAPKRRLPGNLDAKLSENIKESAQATKKPKLESQLAEQSSAPSKEGVVEFADRAPQHASTARRQKAHAAAELESSSSSAKDSYGGRNQVISKLFDKGYGRHLGDQNQNPSYANKELASKSRAANRSDLFKKTAERFEDLALSKELAGVVREKLGHKTPTRVQVECLKTLLNQKDAIICSPTGSGKTLAYLLPVFQTLSQLQPRVQRTDGVLALILSPTRELALQITSIAVKLNACCHWIVTSSLLGGEKKKSEKARIRKGINVLVATPGRLVDHIRTTRTLNLAHTRWLILDEADRLLELGFEPDLKLIIGTTNGHHPNFDDLPTDNPTAHSKAYTDDEEGEDIHHKELDQNEDLSIEKDGKEDDKVVSKTKGNKAGKSSAPYVKRPQLQMGEDEVKQAKPVRDRWFKGKWLVRQNVLVSATINDRVKGIIRHCLRDPVLIKTELKDLARHIQNITAEEDALQQQESGLPENTAVQNFNAAAAAAAAAANNNGEENGESATVWEAPSQLRQNILFVPDKQRLVALIAFLRHYNYAKIIVFAATCDLVDFLYSILCGITSADEISEGGQAHTSRSGLFGGTPVIRLHGNLASKHRSQAISSFRNADQGAVLLSTDVAARGLDLPRVSWIVQYTVPLEISDYVHRIGRTARAGQEGRSLLFLQPMEQEYVDKLKEHGMHTSNMQLTALLRSLGEHMQHIAQQASASGKNPLDDDDDNSQMDKGAVPLAACTKTTLGNAQSVAASLQSAIPAFLGIKANSVEGAITGIQNGMEEMVKDNEYLMDLAKKAYLSFVRAYATYPSELKAIMSVKKLHLGHLAKSFALRDTPANIASKYATKKHKIDAAPAKKRKNKAGTRVDEGVRNNSHQSSVLHVDDIRSRYKKMPIG